MTHEDRKKLGRRALAWILAFCAASGAMTVNAAATPPAAQTEINYLLTFVENSGCAFNRNGTWYDAKRGAAHLREKYNWLATRGKIQTAEDFVEQAATESSMTGKAYQVRCGGGAALPSARWLRDALSKYRSCGPKCAAVPPLPAPPTPREVPSHAQPRAL